MRVAHLPRRGSHELEELGQLGAEAGHVPPEAKGVCSEGHSLTQGTVGVEDGRQVRRRAVEQGLEDGDHPVQHGVVARERVGVGGGELAQLRKVLLLAGAQQQVAAVQHGRERRRVPLVHVQAVAVEFELAHDGGAEEGVDVGCTRELEARHDLLGHSRAPCAAVPRVSLAVPGWRGMSPGSAPVAGPRTDAMAALEDEDALSGPREVRGGS